MPPPKQDLPQRHLPLWLHINLWKTFSCVVLWAAAALPSVSVASVGKAASSSSPFPSSSSSLTPTTSVFLACWTSYCLCWLLKSSLYPDKRWANPATRTQRAFVWGVLTTYLVAPCAMLRSRNDGCSPISLATFVVLYSMGNFWHYVSDAHKHTALALRPNKLVTGGLFARSRNPNYFGELLTYLCLAGLPARALRSPLPLLPLAVSLCLEWIPNMRGKDASLRRFGGEWERWVEGGAAFLFPSMPLKKVSKDISASFELDWAKEALRALFEFAERFGDGAGGEGGGESVGGGDGGGGGGAGESKTTEDAKKNGEEQKPSSKNKKKNKNNGGGSKRIKVLAA